MINEKKLAKAFRALAEETRLKLIKQLASGEKCVCQLFRALDLPQPKVSRHLAYLKKAGLVKNRKEGLWQHYSLNTKLIAKLGLKQLFKSNRTRIKGRRMKCG